MGAARQDLSVLGDRHLDPGDRPPHRAGLDPARLVEGDHRRRLRQPIAFQDRETGREEETRQVRVERSPARNEVADPAAGQATQPGKDQPVGQPILQRQPGARPPLLEFAREVPASHIDGPAQQPLLRRAALACHLLDAGEDLLVSARDHRHHGGPHLEEVLGDGRERLRVADGHPGVEHDVMAGHALEDVR